MIRTLGLALLLSASLAAQEPVRPPTDRIREAVPPAGAMPTLLQDIGLDQKLNERLPLSLEFVDEAGRPVKLGDDGERGPYVRGAHPGRRVRRARVRASVSSCAR